MFTLRLKKQNLIIFVSYLRNLIYSWVLNYLDTYTIQEKKQKHFGSLHHQNGIEKKKTLSNADFQLYFKSFLKNRAFTVYQLPPFCVAYFHFQLTEKELHGWVWSVPSLVQENVSILKVWICVVLILFVACLGRISGSISNFFCFDVVSLSSVSRILGKQ